jgi:putative oxidoreductase
VSRERLCTFKGVLLRRLFSTFAGGVPGAGLLVLRAAAGGVLITEAVNHLSAAPPIASAAIEVFSIVAAGLLITGLWTPVSGTLVAAAGMWDGLSAPSELSSTLLLAAIGAALVMLGPGAWSVDARLYGWRRIDVGDRRSDRLP